MAVQGENQGGLTGFAKQAAGTTLGSLSALWTKENAASTAFTLGTAGLGAMEEAGRFGAYGLGAMARVGNVAKALEPVGKGMMLWGGFSGGVSMGEGISGQDIRGNALTTEERWNHLKGGAFNSGLSLLGGAAGVGKLGALSKPILTGLATSGSFSDSQDVGAAMTGRDIEGKPLSILDRLGRGATGLLGVLGLASPGGKHPLTPESHGDVGGRLTPQEQKVLGNTASKRGSELTQEELHTELELAGKAERQPIKNGEYVEEIKLPNDHELKKQKDGTWCRFSNPPGDCGPQFDPDKSTPSPSPKKRGGSKRSQDPRTTKELPPGEVRTPDEVKKTRDFFKNHKEEAKQLYTQRTGDPWPKDPATGKDARASHPRALADGADPMFVEPAFGDSNTEHIIPNPVTGETDQQRFGKRRRTNSE